MTNFGSDSFTVAFRHLLYNMCKDDLQEVLSIKTTVVMVITYTYIYMSILPRTFALPKFT